MFRVLILIGMLWFVVGCQEKAKPVVRQSGTLQTPISCMALNPLEGDRALMATLKSQYAFTEDCPYKLTLSYKKDIVCNSSYNAMSKNMGKFPKSFVKLELRRGMGVVYSYYVDLYSNVDEEDVIEGFTRLKKDLLSK